MKQRSIDPAGKFLHACQSGDLARIEALVGEHDIRDWTGFRHATSGDTALHVAAREGHLNVVRYLCEGFEVPKYKVDVANKDVKRPLHEAAQFARSDVLKYLIEKGASVDALKRADWTPLMLACTKTGADACECVSRLLEAQANPFTRNKDGWSSFLVACRAGDEKILRLLLKNSPTSIDDRSNNRRSAMHIAAFHGHRHVLDVLMAANSNLVNAVDASGASPLHEAIKSGNLEVVNEIIRLGADVRAKDNVGQTILHIAALTGNVAAIECILRKNLIDVSAETFFGMTPLAAARRGGQELAVEVLIRNGATK
ncbi:hypothetical protein KM043_004500 [Ampulex compressa]|nr:hypothetical protein KM043_004500 [Ampulex compressa]